MAAQPSEAVINGDHKSDARDDIVVEEKEEKVSQVTNKLDDEQKIILDNNIVTTDEGALSYFGDANHNTLNIRIIDTEEVKGRILKHTSFIIESSINNNITVSRRYNDFKWLHNVLSIEYLCIFIPPIPQPNNASNILNKFNKQFVSQRRYDLERFLNRVFNNTILAKSQSVEVFLTQQSQTRFEEQQKSIKEKLLSRSDVEIAEFIQTECFPDLDFAIANNSDEKQQQQHMNKNMESTTDHNIYYEQIPRMREVYMRCDEKFTAMEKVSRNIFKIMTNIVLEIGTMNSELSGLYDLETNERPQVMENEWQKRVEICDFISKWKQVEQNQMYCYYKYFLLHLKYSHEDCLAILDIFVRFDIVFNKYKKIMANQKSNEKKNEGVKVEESVHQHQHSDISDSDEVKENVNNDENVDDGNGNDELQDKMKNIKLLLDVVCTIILKEQIPKLWKKRADDFNTTIDEFRKKYVECALDEDYI